MENKLITKLTAVVTTVTKEVVTIEARLDKYGFVHAKLRRLEEVLEVLLTDVEEFNEMVEGMGIIDVEWTMLLEATETQFKMFQNIA